MHGEGYWQRFIDGLRQGDEAVLLDFWELYGRALHQVAEKNLARALRRRIGPEDAVQSACRTFFRRARVGQFQLKDAEELWRLLCAITLTKLREQTRFHLRQKRGLGQEVHAAEDTPAPLAPGPTPDQAAEFADLLERLLEGLGEREREIVALKLEEYTHEEIAQRVGCSDRTVRRTLQWVRTSLLKDLETA